jgi:hypothetical protein
VNGPPNESLSGWWWLVEFLPKRIKDPAANFAPRWIIHWGRHRHVGDNAKIHMSVLERKKLVAGYDPPNLPADHELVQ